MRQPTDAKLGWLEHQPITPKELFVYQEKSMENFVGLILIYELAKEHTVMIATIDIICINEVFYFLHIT